LRGFSGFSVAPSTRVGADRQRVAVARAAAGEHDETAVAFAFGNGREPQVGSPRASGMIQIWKMRVVSFSTLYSAWRMPLPALITCTSPASVRPLLPRLSSWVIAPSRT
jgi:hypothetical protein